MVELKIQPSETEYQQARLFSSFRSKCKNLLSQSNRMWDKFSVVEHDSFIGYLAELYLADYIQRTFPEWKLHPWSADFDHFRLMAILSTAHPSAEDLDYLKGYFFDRYDFMLQHPDGRSLRIDVKTACTIRQPQSSWSFLYPCVQIGQEGKDLMALAYCIVDDVQRPARLHRLVIAGACTPAELSLCERIPAGQRTRHGTLSQIDNYLTELGQHYQPLKHWLGSGLPDE